MVAFISYGNLVRAWTKLKVNPKNLTGKTVLITGGNEGIGFETALQLAKMNAKIIIASRNLSRSEQAVAKIKQLSHNSDIYCFQLDLGSIQSVNEFIEKFKQEFPVLDILINNSGISPVSYSKSKDGMESCVQVNHLSPFLLTLKLVELLEKAEMPRIVNLSSRGHEFATLSLPGDLHTAKEAYKSFPVYCKTKLMNILFTKELAKRLAPKNISVVAVHPGFVNTNIGVSSIPSPIVRFFVNILLSFFRFLFARNTHEGAKTTVFAAIDDSVKTGEYYDSCKPAEVSEQGKDSNLASSLWTYSANLMGIDPNFV
ncbi:hypothetical protein CONCODRAFT_8819 [Conidiobolus coronatus NRRL 28638]|uniref:NAD(P)-binding protein n=1 Tax=Conidiobolus coronatus (strain ATCC 28846 / CBS 209.66 / NRRL 28638) TaxID=796925 RepID=A0A137P1B6_CONC2|nr:hypothetical protein CONCODRAFT_8819 [Conidiobolus coronatus NRRL 28638]|eukprot:KXN68855.1 hypothetical protein CONCODRAFT_8819 [Conidiobolus coronatus NRRL 28638]